MGRFGLTLSAAPPGALDLKVLAAVTGISGVMALLPAIIAMRASVADGLSIKL